jgi:hypothetical protein
MKDSTQLQLPMTPEQELIHESVQRAFDISPETVYGVLVGLMLITIIWLSWYLYTCQKKLMELNISTIEVLKDLNTSLLLLKEEGDNHSSKLIDHISHTREHISEKINNLENRISSS